MQFSLLHSTKETYETGFRHVISFKLLVIDPCLQLASYRQVVVIYWHQFDVFVFSLPFIVIGMHCTKRHEYGEPVYRGILNWHLLNSSPYAVEKTKNLCSCSSKVVLRWLYLNSTKTWKVVAIALSQVWEMSVICRWLRYLRFWPL